MLSIIANARYCASHGLSPLLNSALVRNDAGRSLAALQMVRGMHKWPEGPDGPDGKCLRSHAKPLADAQAHAESAVPDTAENVRPIGKPQLRDSGAALVGPLGKPLGLMLTIHKALADLTSSRLTPAERERTALAILGTAEANMSTDKKDDKS